MPHNRHEPQIRRLDSRAADFQTRFAEFLTDKREVAVDVNQAVAEILAQVQSRGDEAVLDYTRKFDRVDYDIGNLRLPGAELDQAMASVPSEQIQALQDLGAGIQLDVAPLEEEIDGLRNQILAGEVAEREGLVELQNLLADYEAAAEPYRSGITTILSAVQHRSLQAAMFETRPYLDQGVLGARAGYGRGVAYGRGLSPGFGYGVRPAYGRGGAMGFRGNMALGAWGGVGLGAGRAGRNFLRFSPRGIRYRR